MAAVRFEIFENKMFQESLEQLVKSLVRKMLEEEIPTQGLSPSTGRVENSSFSSIKKKEMPDLESLSNSSCFLDELASDLSFNALRDDDPAITNLKKQLQDSSTISKEEITATTLNSDSGSYTDDPETSVSTKEGAQDPGINKEMDPFIINTLRGIKKVAPNLRYKPKNLRRKKFKVVPYEFSSVWRNVSTIFSEVENANHSFGSIMPKITWEKVNVGGLKKLPSPKQFPVLSASADPKFYVHNCSCDKTREGILCSCRMCDAFKAKYTQVFPHGSIYGFASNLGVVPVPDTPMFGHVWDDDSSSWLLHAEVAPDATPASSTPSEGRRERTQPRRRSRGTSRGTPRWTRRGRVSG